VAGIPAEIASNNALLTSFIASPYLGNISKAPLSNVRSLYFNSVCTSVNDFSNSVKALILPTTAVFNNLYAAYTLIICTPREVNAVVRLFVRPPLLLNISFPLFTSFAY